LWLSIDPLAEKFPNASPYNYCLGNPINLVDPDGRAPEPPKNGIPQFIDNTGVYHWDASRNKYEHYSPKNGTFQGYYTVNSSSKAVGKSVSIDNSKPATITEPSFSESLSNFGHKMSAKMNSLQGSSTSEYQGVDGMMEFADDLGKSSTYVKGAGALVTASSVVLGPEMIVPGTLIYNVGSGMDDVSTALTIHGNFSKGNNTEAAKDGAFLLLGKATDGIIDKNIPQASNPAANTLFKFGTDKVNNNMKENEKKGHNN